MKSHRHDIRIVIEFLRYSGFFLTNYKVSLKIMSISAIGSLHFRIYLWNTKSLGPDNWLSNRYVQYCAIKKYFT